MPNYVPGGPEASWKGFHKQHKHYKASTSLLILIIWRVMRIELICLRVNNKFLNKTRNAYLTPNISNNARNGWFVIPLSNEITKMWKRTHKWHNKQNEILQWWCIPIIYGINKLHLFKELNIELSHVLPCPNILSTFGYSYHICFYLQW